MKDHKLRELVDHITKRVKIHKIRAALKQLPPDCDYATWVKYGLALRRHFRDDINRGLALYDEWSSGALTVGGEEPSNYDAVSIKKQWYSFKPDSGVTIATLFFDATLARRVGAYSRPDCLVMKQLTSGEGCERDTGKVIKSYRPHCMIIDDVMTPEHRGLLPSIAVPTKKYRYKFSIANATSGEATCGGTDVGTAMLNARGGLVELFGVSLERVTITSIKEQLS